MVWYGMYVCMYGVGFIGWTAECEGRTLAGSIQVSRLRGQDQNKHVYIYTYIHKYIHTSLHTYFMFKYVQVVEARRFVSLLWTGWRQLVPRIPLQGIPYSFILVISFHTFHKMYVFIHVRYFPRESRTRWRRQGRRSREANLSLRKRRRRVRRFEIPEIVRRRERWRWIK